MACIDISSSLIYTYAGTRNFPVGVRQKPEKGSINRRKIYIGGMIVDMRNMVKEGGEKDGFKSFYILMK